MTARYTREEIEAIHDQPFFDLVFQARTVHRQHHDPGAIQWSTLLSVKTGACPEDCSYCSQSARYGTDTRREPLLDVETVLAAAKRAKEQGSTRFCMGAAWRRVNDRDVPALENMVREVKSLGLETCMTLGTVTSDQAERLAEAGLDYYNHNLDTSREHYPKIISTRGYDERLETLRVVREAGMNVCCGGILGLGEEKVDRIGLLAELANLPTPPESVPVNQLIAIKGTPLHDEGVEAVEAFDFVRFIATARVLMPGSYIRLSAGRTDMSDELQAWCFFAGANSLFTGDTLLTASNPSFAHDRELLTRLGLRVEKAPQNPTRMAFP